MAQPGSVPEWGSGGRGFKSPLPDQINPTFATPLRSPDRLLNSPRLTFHGVANHCSVWLNGTKLGTHEGMFGGPSFDVSALLQETNVLIVRLDPIPEVFRDDDRASSNESWNRTVVFNNVYGWHYSKLPSLGIWRSVIIQNQAGVELDHAFIATRNLRDTHPADGASYKLNDNYPAASWSSVDWYGAPKPLHYFAQDSFSPLASVVLFEKTDMHGGSVSLPVFLLDDNLDLRKLSWTVRVRVFDQRLTQTGGIEFSGKDNQKSVTRLGELLLSSEQTRTSPLLIVSEVLAGRKLAFRTFYYMNFEQQQGSLFNLPRTTLSLEIRANKAVVRNTGKVPAAGVNLEAPGRADQFVASDNFFWLDAGESAEVDVNITTGLSANAWNLDGHEQVNAPP